MMLKVFLLCDKILIYKDSYLLQMCFNDAYYSALLYKMDFVESNQSSEFKRHW